MIYTVKNHIFLPISRKNRGKCISLSLKFLEGSCFLVYTSLVVCLVRIYCSFKIQIKKTWLGTLSTTRKKKKKNTTSSFISFSNTIHKGHYVLIDNY